MAAGVGAFPRGQTRNRADAQRVIPIIRENTPRRFCVGWASYDNLRHEIVYPEKLQLEQELEAAEDAFLAAKEDYEEARRQYNENKEDLLAKQRKKAAKQRMRDRNDDFDLSAAVQRIDEVHDVASPVEPDPVPEERRAPTGSGISYENSPRQNAAGAEPLRSNGHRVCGVVQRRRTKNAGRVCGRLRVGFFFFFLFFFFFFFGVKGTCQQKMLLFHF